MLLCQYILQLDLEYEVTRDRVYSYQYPVSMLGNSLLSPFPANAKCYTQISHTPNPVYQDLTGGIYKFMAPGEYYKVPETGTNYHSHLATKNMYYIKTSFEYPNDFY